MQEVLFCLKAYQLRALVLGLIGDEKEPSEGTFASKHAANTSTIREE